MYNPFTHIRYWVDGTFVRPWLKNTHPEFFLDVTIKMLIQVSFGLYLLLAQDASFMTAGLKHVNDYLAPTSWGMLHLTAGLGIFVGLHLKTFTAVRGFLAMAFVLLIMRAGLLAWAWWDGTAVGLGPLAFTGLALVIVPSIREPPINPATDRR